QHHAHRGEDDLGADPVHVLGGDALVGVPRRPGDLAEVGALVLLHLLGGHAGGRQHADRYGVGQPVDGVGGGALGVDVAARGDVAVARLDVVHVAVGRLDDVRVGRDRQLQHGSPWVVPRRACYA